VLVYRVSFGGRGDNTTVLISLVVEVHKSAINDGGCVNEHRAKLVILRTPL
jgi:hypothetical protein